MDSQNIPQQNCLHCQKPIKGLYPNRKFCNRGCASKHKMVVSRDLYPHREFCSVGQSGAASELVVCVDLLKRGFDVFRAVAPSCSCDLVLFHAGHMLRVEVKTGARTKAGDISWGSYKYPSDRFDVLAVVMLDSNEIFYNPPVAEWFKGAQGDANDADV